MATLLIENEKAFEPSTPIIASLFDWIFTVHAFKETVEVIDSRPILMEPFFPHLAPLSEEVLYNIGIEA